MKDHTEYTDETNNDESSDDFLVSKSQRKREATEAQKLGQDLVELDAKALNTIELPENLRHAIDEARRIRSHGALKRQLQYIGKLMRTIELEPIREQYSKIINHYNKDIKELHLIENWRDRLLIEGDKALEELIIEAPTTDRQHLRQLIRQAAKESKLNKPPKSAREIFQYLKILLSND